MFINSDYIVHQDAHHGATFDSIWYLFTYHLMHVIGQGMITWWCSGPVQAYIDMFADIAQGQLK